MIKSFIVAALLTCACFGQVAVAPMTNPRVQYFDADGLPLAGGKLYTYTAGTTTPLATYADSTGTMVNPNPISLDSSGSATIFLKLASYKFVMKNAVGVTQWIIDGVTPSSGGGGSGVTLTSRPGVNVITDCGAQGYPHDDTAAIAACEPTWRGRTLYFPKLKAFGAGPDYLFEISPTNAPGTRFQGEGVGAATTAGAATAVQRIHNTPAFNLYNCNTCVVDGFEVIGDQLYLVNDSSTAIYPAVSCAGNAYGNGRLTGDSTDDGIIVGSAWVRVSNVRGSGSGRYGLRVDGTSSDFVVVEHSTFIDNRGYGICMGGGSDGNAFELHDVTTYTNGLGGFDITSLAGGGMVTPRSEFDGGLDADSEGPALTNTALVRASNVVTVTTSTAHNLLKGMGVMNRNNDAGFNCDPTACFVATVPSSTTYTYTLAGADGSSALKGTTNRAKSLEALAAAGHPEVPYKINTSGQISVFNFYCESAGSNHWGSSGNVTVFPGQDNCATDWTTAPPYMASGILSDYRAQGHKPSDSSPYNQYMTLGWGGGNDRSYPAMGAFVDSTTAQAMQFVVSTPDANGASCFAYEPGLSTNHIGQGWEAFTVCPQYGIITTGVPASFGLGLHIGDRETGPTDTTGTGAPTGKFGHGEAGNCLTGSTYRRRDGGAGSTLYVCEVAAWAAK